MKKKFFAAMATGIFLSALASNAGATILFTEDFETGDLRFGSHWSESASGQVTQVPSASGKYALSFKDNNWWAGDTFSTLIDTTGAATYTLSFDYMTTEPCSIRSGGGFVGLDADGTKNWDTPWFHGDPTLHSVYFTPRADDGWRNVNITFSLSAKWEKFSLMFEDFRAPAGDAFFDNIVLSDSNREPTNPVPEPATMLLFGTGLLGLVGRRLRKNK